MRRGLPFPELAQLFLRCQAGVRLGRGPPQPEASQTPCYFGPCQLGAGAEGVQGSRTDRPPQAWGLWNPIIWWAGPDWSRVPVTSELLAGAPT